MLTSLMTIFIIAQGEPVLVLAGNDPVELVIGNTVAGKESLTANFGMHTYRFATTKNQSIFKKSPLKFAVQNGGACGKMGALSGKGNPERWAVVRGKIYLFASEGCRETFLKNEEAYFRVLPVLDKPTREQKKAAQQLFRRMVLAHGGEPVTKMRSIEWTVETPYQEAGKNKIWVTKDAYFGPTKLASWSEWDAGTVFNYVNGRAALEGKPSEVFPMHPGEKRELIAQIVRHPAVVLMSDSSYAQFVDETGNGFWMNWNDLTFRVKLNETTKRIDSISFTDIYQGPVSDVVKKYGDYQDIFGIALPFSVQTKIDRGEFSKLVQIKSYEINGTEPNVFKYK